MRLWVTAVVAIVAATLAACTLAPAQGQSQPPNQTEPKPPEQKAPEPNVQHPPEQPKTQEPPPPPEKAIEAADEEWKKKLEEFMKTQDVGTQAKIVESQKHYQIALKKKEAGDFQGAKEACDKALEVWPGNVEARRLKDTLDAILQQRSRPQVQDVIDQNIAKWKGQILEITNLIRTGERYVASKEFEAALDRFQQAEVQILAMPDQIPEKGTFLPLVRDYIQKIRAAMEEEARVKLEMQRRRAMEEQRLAAEAERREMVRKIADMLELAYMAFDQKKYDECIRLCQKILDIDPHYSVALELKEDAMKTKVRVQNREYVRKKIDGWKEMTSADNEARIPYQDTVIFPSKEKWLEIERRAQEATIKAVEELQEPEEIAQVRKKLDSMKITLNYDNEKLQPILDYLHEYTGLSFLIDNRVKAEGVDIEKTIPFKVKDITVTNALKYLLEQYGLDFTVTEDKIVLITKPQYAQGKPVLELYDIRDLVIKLNNFPGPKLELTGGEGAAGAPGITFTLEEPEQPKVSGEDIISLIKENIEKASWESGEAYSINMTPNQQLLVYHTPKTQRAIRDFLNRLRSYTGLMVSVTVRFLAAYDDSLLDVGVDLINRPPAPNTYDIFGAGFTDIDALPAEIGPGFVTNESAGAEFYDLRAQTFHTMLKVDPITLAAQLPILVDPTSGRLRNQGGLGMQYQWIGEQAIQAVLRAVQKNNKATIVQAPRITVFNTQRAHILVVSRLAYIKDYDVVAVGFLAAYDPIIGHLTHGLVLDIKPIISHDRKYVTLELRTDFAELQFMRFVFLAAGNVLPVQLPWVVFQRAQATVLVPDRGTLVVSGFRDTNLTDTFSGVPFLENIPIISLFFTRKAKLQQKRRLFVLITPEIIDMSEHERRLMD